MSPQMARKIVLSAAIFLLLITYIEYQPPGIKVLQFLGPIRYGFLVAFFIAMGSFMFDAVDRQAESARSLIRMSLVAASLLIALAFVALVISFIMADPLVTATLHAHLT